MVEIYVKPDLRDEIKSLKQGLTYDQYLRNLINSGRKFSQSSVSKRPIKEEKVQ